MPVEIQRMLVDVGYSVYKWLRTLTYTAGGVTGTLGQHFQGLVVREGYPGELTKLDAPTLALVGPDAVQPGVVTMGPGIREDLLLLSLHGFVVKQGRDQQNRLYRDRLMNDCYQVLPQQGQDEGIPLWEHASKSVIGGVEVSRVDARLLPALAPEIEAERFRFLVNFEVAHSL